MQGGAVGRDAELAALAHLVDGVTDGPAVLALQGEAGIGKTTVWAAGVDQACQRDFTVPLCRPLTSG